MTATKKRKPFKFEKKVLNRPAWDQKYIDVELLQDEDPPTRQRTGRRLWPNEPEPRQLVQARRRFAKEYGSSHATIKPGQWQQHYHRPYAVWVHRLARAVSKEIDQMPAQPPPLPWPIRRDPINEIRAYNSSLFPRVPVNPNPRVYLNTYVPKTVDLDRARTEVYRPDQGEDWLWRIRIFWDEPRPWEIEAFVDPGGALYLPFFRQVTIRLPLKAKICRDLKARKDGQWVGNCQSVKKLNAREAIGRATESLINNEQLIVNNGGREGMDNGQWIMENGERIEDRFAENLAEQPPQGLRPSPLLGQGGELAGAARPSKKPAKAGTPNACFPPQPLTPMALS